MHAQRVRERATPRQARIRTDAPAPNLRADRARDAHEHRLLGVGCMVNVEHPRKAADSCSGRPRRLV
jgi:hypothetical protein